MRSVTALTAFEGSYYGFLDGLPTLYRWDGAADWTLVKQISQNGEAHAIAVYDGHLFVAGNFWNTSVVYGGNPGSLIAEYFAIAMVDLDAGVLVPTLGPCEGGNDCGTVETLLVVEDGSPLDGAWFGGSGLLGIDTGIVGRIVKIDADTYGSEVPLALGIDAQGVPGMDGVLVVEALAIGVDPDPAAAPGELTLVAGGAFAEEGTFGVARYHLSAGWLDSDADGWVGVEAGLPWEDRCPPDAGPFAGVCVNSNVLGVAFFQDELYVAGTFSGAWAGDNGDGDLMNDHIDVPALATWNGSDWGTIEDADLAVLGGISEGYSGLLADGDDVLYLLNPHEFVTPATSAGICAWDGVDVTSLQGGVQVQDGLLDTGPGWLASAYLDGDHSLLLGGPFTWVGWPETVEAAGNLILSPGIARFDPAAVCPADLTGDEAVNAQDLALLLSQWGLSAPEGGDLDGDGSVNAPDLAILLSVWGDCG